MFCRAIIDKSEFVVMSLNRSLSRKDKSMERETTGKVISASKQWWLKVNTKAVRNGPMDGAVFPHNKGFIYTVNGIEYTKRKWISAGVPVPAEGNSVKIVYDEDSPKKANIIY